MLFSYAARRVKKLAYKYHFSRLLLFDVAV